MEPNRRRIAPALPGQVVLVLQGGGALGAYQAGVYQALHEAGVEPDWVIGTSIGAINASLICGNAPEHRLERLAGLLVARSSSTRGTTWSASFPGLRTCRRTSRRSRRAFPSFFAPNPLAWLGAHVPLGIEAAAYYTMSPLRDTLSELVDLDIPECVPHAPHRGGGQRGNGEMRYFDSRDEPVSLDHVLASGALPPAFPAVRIDGQPIGMAASTRTRRSRPCSTTIRAATR